MWTKVFTSSPIHTVVSSWIWHIGCSSTYTCLILPIQLNNVWVFSSTLINCPSFPSVSLVSAVPSLQLSNTNFPVLGRYLFLLLSSVLLLPGHYSHVILSAGWRKILDTSILCWHLWVRITVSLIHRLRSVYKPSPSDKQSQTLHHQWTYKCSYTLSVTNTDISHICTLWFPSQ